MHQVYHPIESAVMHLHFTNGRLGTVWEAPLQQAIINDMLVHVITFECIYAPSHGLSLVRNSARCLKGACFGVNHDSRHQGLLSP